VRGKASGQRIGIRSIDGCFQERRVDVIERVLHRGSGEHRDGFVLRLLGRSGRREDEGR
jgi:hypothetical protein